MNARDVMTTKVVSAPPDMPVRQVARLLIENGISAVPVVDEDGAAIGMVSEGDLIGREAGDRDARRDWWLTLVAERDKPESGLVKRVLTPGPKARDIMAGPVVTVTEDTDVREIARLLSAYRIKRVPVVRDGRVVGIVSRADLLRAFAAEPPPAEPGRKEPGLLAGAISSIDDHFLHRRHVETRRLSSPPPEPADAEAKASEFQRLVADFEENEIEKRVEARAVAQAERKHRVEEIVGQHLSDEAWHALVGQARDAAKRGEKEFMLLRFPSQSCSDGGRAINVTESDWAATLRGEAAEIFLRWEHDLKPRGFRLFARVLDFPGGKPGDIGLFLTWGA
jgi:CBS domain-containing protein